MDRDPTRWLRRGVAIGVLVLGWLFVLWSNKFHITAPVFFVLLGYLAVVATVYNLWRTGAAAVAPENATADAWLAPIGPRGELDKEKKTLLKAIKEAEFDHQMGKLSKVDADDMIRTYRGRAIEVIKELDRLDAGQAETTRDKIEREVRARLELHKASRAKKKDEPAKPAEEPPKPVDEPAKSEATQ